METPAEWIPFVIGNIPVFIFIGWIMFRSWGQCWDDFLWMLTPDIISLFRGRLAKDWWGEFRFVWFTMACLLIALGEKALIDWLTVKLVT